MGRETAMFFLLNGVGVLIQQACIELAKHEFGRNDKVTVNAAFLVGVMLATLFRFWSYRKWVWRLAPPGAEPVEPVEPDQPAEPGESAVHPAQVNGHSHGQRGGSLWRRAPDGIARAGTDPGRSGLIGLVRPFGLAGLASPAAAAPG
jgi:hypothetical protein